jgi:hypothetical protein
MTLAMQLCQAHEDLRGAPYLLSLDEVARRTAEAWGRGATEVCMQVTPTDSAGTHSSPQAQLSWHAQLSEHLE